MEYNDFIKQAKLVTDEVETVGMRPTEAQKESVLSVILDAQNKYRFGDKFEKGEANEQILSLKNNMLLTESFKYDTASAVMKPDSFSVNSYNRLNETIKNGLVNIFNKSNLPVTKEGKPGYIINNKFMGLGEIQDEIKKVKVDDNSKNIFNIMRDDVSRSARKIQGAEFSDFNFRKTYANVYDNLVSQGDLNSLANDKVVANRIFKDDFEKAIMAGSYKDFGITDDMIKDPTSADNKITAEDARIISNELMKDEKLLAQTLTDYFTNSLAKNHYNNLSSEVQRNRAIQLAKLNTPMNQPTSIPPSETLGKVITIDEI
tara:strand:+ start:52 stop:1002 length:951 start_codon:yes stop_codon:yes gene_type:complete